MSNRREFLQQALAAGFAVGAGTLRASDSRRVFVAGFSHETNTFHPVKTTSFGFAEVSRNPLPIWKGAGLTIVPGIHAYPNGGGTIEEKPCRGGDEPDCPALHYAPDAGSRRHAP